MKLLIAMFSIFAIVNMYSFKIDFGENLNGNSWYVINDGVMGGLSQSKLSFNTDYVVFKGTTSLKNNGGFASMRSETLNLDISSFEKVKIKYKTTSNRTFGLRLALYNAYYMPNLKYNFKATTNDWEELEIPLENFKVYRMGRFLKSDFEVSKLKDILRVGIIVSDKKEGNFEIAIDSIEFI